MTNDEYECKWPDAEKLVSQLYKVCLEEAACFANLGNGKCIAELNSKYSYVNSELKVFITSDNFRRHIAFDGENLVKNTNSYILIGPKHNVTTAHGLENIDGKFPDPFYKQKQNISCPKVECTPDNCYCRCRPDNCNDRPVGPGPPAIVTMGLEDFREGKIKASEMLVAPRISECFGLPWSAFVCYSLPWSAIVCLGLL